MSSPTIVVHSDADQLAEAAAGRLVDRLIDVQEADRTATVVLTGGSIAAKLHAAAASSPRRDEVDWGRVEVWWGDERFLPEGDPERNETQAREALLADVPVALDRVHPMPAADGPVGGDPDAAAEAYARELFAAARPEDQGPTPMFDLLLLGLGPDGHVASLFPGHSALYDERVVAAVRDSPKPPPTRLSLTFPTLARARETWFVVAGGDKADAVRLALSGADVVQIPAAGVVARQQTLWLIDQDAASQLPSDLLRTPSS